MANSSVGRILKFVRKHRRFLVSGHVRSDGDALGSQLAFHFALRRMGKRSHVVCDRGVAPEYAFLPGSSGVGGDPSDLRPPYDAVITFDSGGWSRLERIADALGKIFIINIDHHASNERFGDLNWVDAGFSSSGEMAWELIRAAGVKPDRRIATCVYTAMVTDTGRFSFSNTTPETHRRAAQVLGHGVRPEEIHRALFRRKTPAQLRFAAECIRALRLSPDGRVGWITITDEMMKRAGFVPSDTQEYVDLVQSLRDVRAALLFREVDEPGKVKVSFRTDRGIDGVALASKWGGGGHRRASGATVRGELRGVEAAVVAETIRFVRRER